MGIDDCRGVEESDAFPDLPPTRACAMMPVAPNELAPPVDARVTLVQSVASSNLHPSIMLCRFEFNRRSWALATADRNSSTLLRLSKPPAPAVPSMWPRFPFREAIDTAEDANTPAKDPTSTGSPSDVPVPWASMNRVSSSPLRRSRCYYDDPFSAVNVAL